MIKCSTLARVRVRVVCVCACGLLGYRASARVQRMLTRTWAHAGHWCSLSGTAHEYFCILRNVDDRRQRARVCVLECEWRSEGLVLAGGTL